MFYPKSPFLGKGLQLENEILKVHTAALPQLLSWLCQTPRITTYRVNTLRTSVIDYKAKLQEQLKQRYGHQAPRVYGLHELPEMLCIAPLDAPADAQYDDALRQLIVDTSCGAALLRGAHIFAPGVLAMETGTQLQELVNVFADLAGKCKRGTATRYVSDEKIFLGVGRVLMQRHQLYNNNKESASGIAVHMETNVSGVPTLGDLSDADALLQNLPSIVCVRVLGPQPGESVLDMCAAPGNKTTHIAELMGDVGRVVALDNSASRVRGMQSKLANYRCIEAYHFDATKALNELGEECSTGPPFAAESFDRILLDAPCSGLGNRPQLSCSIKQAKVLQSYPHVQRNLLAQAVSLLRPGGVLVYSTCTVTEAECEQLVAWALRKFPQIRLVDAQPKLGAPGLQLAELDDDQCQMLQRFGPSAENRSDDLDTVGFFIAKFEKAKN
ncbi:tRNA (cytosine(72)-C(5))-methyltransferase NSUN6 [Drosophila albomicans]|uniref:tRNA (Cytosine(72)-C(5))-methyltransferase NSUN6 n=1 Tax=Drosophila albomicans TaxID=7291 RepID=A0A6P8X0T6_DROAB|nr:tRNA (cytosine(72)-C(5))-methyltransferase NSUN6 [Drosophila albomicans]